MLILINRVCTLSDGNFHILVYEGEWFFYGEFGPMISASGKLFWHASNAREYTGRWKGPGLSSDKSSNGRSNSSSDGDSDSNNLLHEAVLMHKRYVVLGGTQGTVTLVRSQEKILCAGEIPWQGQWIQGTTRNSRARVRRSGHLESSNFGDMGWPRYIFYQFPPTFVHEGLGGPLTFDIIAPHY